MTVTTNDVAGVAPEHTFVCEGGAEMAAFDTLPRALRDTLNYAPVPSPPHSARRSSPWGCLRPSSPRS